MKVHGSGLKMNGHDVKCTVFDFTVIGEKYTVTNLKLKYEGLLGSKLYGPFRFWPNTFSIKSSRPDIRYELSVRLLTFRLRAV